MNRRHLRNALFAFVAISVLLQIGGQIRQIARGVHRDVVVPATASSPPLHLDQVPRHRATSLQWTGSLAGHVSLEDGLPAAGARVFLEGPSDQEAQADEMGDFFFGHLRPGDYQIFASQEPLASERLGPLPLGAGEELRGLTLELGEGFVLEGIVLGLPERQPLSGATLKAAGQQTNSDDTGHFSLVGLPRGRLTALVEAEGYLSRQVELTPPGQRLSISLERGARVFGVVRSQGTGAAGVEIAARRYDPGMREEPLLPVARTDVHGRFQGFAPLGLVELIAGGGGWAEARSGMLDLRPGEARQVDFRLGQGGTLAGRVLSADRAPQAGCRIEARDAAQERAVSMSVSGRHGEFWLTALPEATYTVLARCPEGSAEMTGVQVEGEDEARIEIVLGTASLGGRVVDARGLPIAGARIDARPQGNGTRATPYWKSDAGGYFSITGLSGDRFTVTARAAEGEAELREVAADRNDLILVLTSSGIEGVARDAHGQRLGDFTLAAIPVASDRGRASGNGGEVTAPGRPRSQRFVSAEGAFRMSLLPGRYDLKVGAPGQRGLTIEGIEVRPNRLERIDLQLQEGVEIAGEVLSEESGLPIAGAIVASDPALLSAFGRAAPVVDGSWARTDASGAFRLSGLLPSEQLTLFVDGEGFQPKLHKVAAPTTAEVRIQLKPQNGAGTADAPDAIVGIGLSLAPRGDRLLVGSVMPFGPAQAAGVRSGDELLRIDGLSVAGWPIADAVGAIRGVVGTSVTLALKRGDIEYETAIPRVEIRF